MDLTLLEQPGPERVSWASWLDVTSKRYSVAPTMLRPPFPYTTHYFNIYIRHMQLMIISIHPQSQWSPGETTPSASSGLWHVVGKVDIVGTVECVRYRLNQWEVVD